MHRLTALLEAEEVAAVVRYWDGRCLMVQGEEEVGVERFRWNEKARMGLLGAWRSGSMLVEEGAEGEVRKARRRRTGEECEREVVGRACVGTSGLEVGVVSSAP